MISRRRECPWQRSLDRIHRLSVWVFCGRQNNREHWHILRPDSVSKLWIFNGPPIVNTIAPQFRFSNPRKRKLIAWIGLRRRGKKPVNGDLTGVVPLDIG